MTAAETLRAAFRNLVRRPLRNALAIVGVLLATATLVALLSLSAAIQERLVARLGDRPLLTTVQVTPGAPRAGEAPRPLDAAAVASLAAIRGVREAVPVIVFPATLRLADRTPSGTALAASPARGAPYSLVAGRAPRADEPGAIALTAVGARGLGLDADTATGRTIALELRRGQSGERRSLELRVVGVAGAEVPGLGIVALALGEDAAAWLASVGDAARDLELAQRVTAALLFGARAAPAAIGGSRYTAAWLDVDTVARVRDVVRDVERLGYAAASNAAAAELVEELFGTINAALAALAAIGFAVAALGVVNALVTSVAERTAEIGVLKALGATDSTVERLILVEAAAIGLAGGTLGVVVGWLGARAASGAGGILGGAGGTLDPRLDPVLALVALVAALGLALVAAWVPARRAARLVPAEALRAE